MSAVGRQVKTADSGNPGWQPIARSESTNDYALVVRPDGPGKIEMPDGETQFPGNQTSR